MFDDTPTSQHWILATQPGQLSYEHVLAEAGEPSGCEQAESACSQLRATRGEDYYSELLFALTHHRYAAREASSLWGRILAHREGLREKLGRNPGIAVAALDYLSNVEAVLARPTLIEELKLSRLVESATRDALTGLYDRESLRLYLAHALASTARPVALVMLDLDHFKLFNDRYGHLAGDDVLSRVSELLRESLRETDIAARYGGEELCVVLPGHDLEEAARVAERVRARIESELAERGVTASLGVASFPHDARDALTLIGAADRALYESKRAGRNRVTCTRVVPQHGRDSNGREP